MALIALVNNGFSLHGVHEKGDIIIVKLDDSPWGIQEDKEFIRIHLDDPDLESQLMNMRLNGEDHPQIVYPYAVFDGDEMTKISYRKFDVDNIDGEVLQIIGATKEELEDNITPVEPLQASVNSPQFKLTDLTE